MQTAEGLTTRLEICVARMGGKRALAAASGVSEAQLYRYITDGSSVPAERLIALARAAGVDAGWLLTGAGAQAGTVLAVRPPLRPHLLAEVSRLLDETLLEYEKRVPSNQRAALLAHIYEAVRLQELREGEAYVPTKLDLTGFLDFLLVPPHEETLLRHQLAMSALENYDPLPPEWERGQVLAQWVKVVAQGYRQYYNMTRGQVFFSVVGFEIAANVAQRLHAMVAGLQDGTGGKPRQMEMLEVGCGNGRELAFLLAHYPWLRGRGIELSDAGVALAQTLEKSGRLPEGAVEQGNMLALPHKNGVFDFVYSRQALFAVPYVAKEEVGAVQALREMARVLRPGGILHVASLRGVGRDYLPLRQYYERDTFEELLAQVPELELVDWQEPAPPAQVQHPAQSRFTRYFLATMKKAG